MGTENSSTVDAAAARMRLGGSAPAEDAAEAADAATIAAGHAKAEAEIAAEDAASAPDETSPEYRAGQAAQTIVGALEAAGYDVEGLTDQIVNVWHARGGGLSNRQARTDADYIATVTITRTAGY